MSDLTICSVAFGNSELLELNVELTSALNRSGVWRWLVIDNAPGQGFRPRTQDRRVEVVPGVEADASRHPRLRGSYQHAAALNTVRDGIGSRFALFLDPDFFLVRPEWMAGVVEHMLDRELAFFGAPWHPRWYTKFRYFPCVHCLFVDLTRVPAGELDFTPEITEEMARDLEREQGKRSLVSGLALAVSLRDRRSIGASHDTGYRVYSRFGLDEATRSETACPVYRPRIDLPGPRHATWWPNRLLERLLPDERCFVPKASGSYVASTFRDLGYPDAAGQGWEEYLWRGEPFGFHVRMQRQDRTALDPEVLSASLARWKPNAG